MVMSGNMEGGEGGVNTAIDINLEEEEDCCVGVGATTTTTI